MVTLRTFSKVYGLAGLRIGYGVMPDEIANLLNRIRLPFNTNSLAQSAAGAALEDNVFFEKVITLIHQGLDFLYDSLDRLGVKYFPTQTNFILIDVCKDADAIYEKMLAADSMIIGAPTYFFDISGAVKTFIDRIMAIFFRDIGPNFHTNMPWHGKRPHFGKPCVLITTAAGEGHDRALESLRFAMDDCTNMKIVASMAEAVEMNDVDDLPEVMVRAEEAGKKLGQALKG